jgi:hypothetical protein
MLVHSPLVDCENPRRGVVRVISGAIVGGPDSKVGRVALQDSGCIGKVTRDMLPGIGPSNVECDAEATCLSTYIFVPLQ